MRVLESTRRTLRPDSLETFKARDRAGPDAAAPRQSRNGAGACSPRPSPAWKRNGGDQRTILYQKWAIATELVALKRSKEASAHVRSGRRRRRRAPGARRSVPAQRGAAAAGLLAPRQVLRARPQGASRQGAGATDARGDAGSGGPRDGPSPPACLLALDVDGVLLDPRRGGRGPWQVAFSERFGVDAGPLGRRRSSPAAWNDVITGQRATSRPPWPRPCTSSVGTWASDAALQCWFEAGLRRRAGGPRCRHRLVRARHPTRPWCPTRSPGGPGSSRSAWTTLLPVSGVGLLAVTSGVVKSDPVFYDRARARVSASSASDMRMVFLDDTAAQRRGRRRGTAGQAVHFTKRRAGPEDWQPTRSPPRHWSDARSGPAHVLRPGAACQAPSAGVARRTCRGTPRAR